jgi:hypothetical protein
MVCLNKKTSSRQEFPRGSCLRFLFYGPITVILKIRQIHNIFIPYYFHWKDPIISSDWCTIFNKILFGIQNIRKTAGLYL